jgi:hypothetical protein
MPTAVEIISTIAVGMNAHPTQHRFARPQATVRPVSRGADTAHAIRYTSGLHNHTPT